MVLLYNLHALKDLLNGKRAHSNIRGLAYCYGEFEMLISLANLSYNNPEFVFPTQYSIQNWF
jgi:hypothetical protein